MLIRSIAILLVAVSLYFLTREGFDAQSWFSWHPTSMIVSFFGFLPEVLMSASRLMKIKTTPVVVPNNNTNNNTQTRNTTTSTTKPENIIVSAKDALLQQHASMALACKLFALIGFGAIYVTKELNGRSHFTSLHGQLGVATMLIFFIQVVLGILQNEIFGFSAVNRKKLRSVHFYCSSILILAATGAMWYGFQTMYFQKNVLKDDPQLLWISYLFGGAIPVLATLAFAL